MSDRNPHDVTERNIDLAFEFVRETLNDPALLEGLRDGVTIVLVPDDDPSLAETNIRTGIEAVRKGSDVYFKHVSASEYASGQIRP